jgi:cytochrome P450
MAMIEGPVMTTTDHEASATAVKLPPGPPVPRAFQGVVALADRRIALQILRRRYGSAFSLHLPIFGRMVVLSDPSHIRQLFKLGADVADTTDANLGRVMGPNSLFALSGDRHRAQRKLLTPPFHGRHLAARSNLRDDALDDAHHSQRHTARGFRGRRSGAGASA